MYPNISIISFLLRSARLEPGNREGAPGVPGKVKAPSGAAQDTQNGNRRPKGGREGERVGPAAPRAARERRQQVLHHPEGQEGIDAVKGGILRGAMKSSVRHIRCMVILGLGVENFDIMRMDCKFTHNAGHNAHFHGMSFQLHVTKILC